MSICWCQSAEQSRVCMVAECVICVCRLAECMMYVCRVAEDMCERCT